MSQQFWQVLSMLSLSLSLILCSPYNPLSIQLPSKGHVYFYTTVLLQLPELELKTGSLNSGTNSKSRSALSGTQSAYFPAVGTPMPLFIQELPLPRPIDHCLLPFI